MIRIGVVPASRLPFRVVLAAMVLLALVRGFLFVTHDPLLAFANNFDQIRFTSCIDVGPDRPGIPPERNSPAAPLRYFSFFTLPKDACYWTSDLLLTAPLALAWRIDEQFGGEPSHSIETLGILRLVCWTVLGGWLTYKWLRAGKDGVALANTTWVAVVGFDPANLLYFNTFYAEPSALLGLYACVGGAALAEATQKRSALVLVALGAVLLATSKLQHLVLPGCLAATAYLTHSTLSRRIALLLLLGTVAGGAVFMVNRTYSGSLLQSLSSTNRADFVLSALLLNVDDPTATASRLGLSADCASRANIGGVYGLHAPAEKVCPGINQISRASAWWQLLNEPVAFARILGKLPGLMLPWIPTYLGTVEGREFSRLPNTWLSLANIVGTREPIAWSLLLAPWVLLVLAWRTPARLYVALCACTTTCVPLVALFGDGYIDLPKHAHLAFNASFGSVCALLAGCRSWFPRVKSSD